MTKIQKRYFNTSETDNNKSVKPEIKLKKVKNKKVIKIRTNLSKYVIRKQAEKKQIDPAVINKYKRGEGIKNLNKIKTKFRSKKIKKKEQAIEWSAQQSARTELLLTEDSGCLEADPGEKTTQFRQKQIVENVDITSAAKHFELQLNDFGPYRLRYTKNGRHLLLGGKRGHVAAFDWITKKLHCEINVLESVFDVCWLHLETMFAVAQKKWVYIYDHQGIEIHCIKKMSDVLRMEFLPYHFLLATSSDKGFLSWLDVSIGEMVTSYNTKLGRLSLMTQNPYNAVLCLGHLKGIVSMWSPNIHQPLVKMLCHNAPLTGLAINPSGTYMATAAVDTSLKIWDLRKLSGPLQYYKLYKSANNLTLSQKNLLAVGTENIVEIYRNCCTESADSPYLRHKMNNVVHNLQFCPYEDVLGVGYQRGFTSLLVPGAGEPNFDALEANPYQTKAQRKESEVKALLEKIPADLICLDPNTIGEVDIPTLQDKLEAKSQLLYVKRPKINVEPRVKKVRGASVKAAHTKQILKEAARREFVQAVNQEKVVKRTNSKKERGNVLDRFKK